MKINKFFSKNSLIGIILLIAMNMQLASVYAQTTDQLFSDVDKENLNFTAINFLKQKNIVAGYKDGTFKPEQTINRAEALKIILLAREYLKLSKTELVKISFPDVKSTDWFYKYVQEGFSLKIVEGYPDGTFKPGNLINRAESLKVIILGLVSDYQKLEVKTAPFGDMKNTDWFAEYALFSKNRQIIEPDSYNRFAPAGEMKRGDFAEIIYRLIFIEENNLDKFPLSQNWPACKNVDQGFVIKYPYNWQKIRAGDQIILWHQDIAHEQLSFARTYPDSAVLVLVKDPNEKKISIEDYLKQINYGSGAEVLSQTLNGIKYSSVYLKESGIQDSYFQFADKSLLIMYGQVGDGKLTEYLKEEARYIIGSVREYKAADHIALENCMPDEVIAEINVEQPTETDVLTQVRQKILVKGEGKSALELLGDTKIILTDTIGIGTGPIDYYYSVKYDITLKYERETDTVLAEKSGENSDF